MAHQMNFAFISDGTSDFSEQFSFKNAQILNYSKNYF